MPVLETGATPPPDYYADHLSRLLAQVAAQYDDVLHDDERGYLDAVLNLPCRALRLYARLASRKGPLFRTDTLRYPEVGDLPAAIAGLTGAGLVAENADAPADRVLSLARSDELTALLPHVPRRLPKAQRIVVAVTRYGDRRMLLLAQRAFAYLARRMDGHLALMQWLFFGGRHLDLATFVMEDLGILRFEPYRLAPRTRVYPDRAALDAALALERLRDAIAEADPAAPARSRWIVEGLWEALPDRAGERRRVTLLNRLGRFYERAGSWDDALTCYARATGFAADERRVRVLARLGDRRGAEDLMRRMANRRAPLRHRDFVQRFDLERARLVADRHCAEQRIRLAAAPPNGVEAAALAVLTANGGSGRHVENALPLGLFGLAFWDAVFDDVPGAFVNAYQRAPLDLYWPDFATARRTTIEALLARYRSAGGLRASLRARWHARAGTANALVSWRHLDAPLLDSVLASMPHPHLLAIFRHLLDDLDHARTGFPDLFIAHGPGSYELVEVKGPSDQLRPEQRAWFRVFEQIGIPARVVRLAW